MQIPDRNLIYVAPGDVFHAWPAVREGLEKVREHTSETWLPEDVYCALKAGQATLHIEKDGGGFVVLRQENHFDGIGLHIWCAYSKSLKKLPVYIDEIRQMARSIGAKRITLSSKRDWSKYFKPAMTLYEEILWQEAPAAIPQLQKPNPQTT